MSNPFWKKILNVFHDGVHEVRDHFTPDEQQAVELGTNAAHYVVQTIGEVGMNAAKEAVIQVENSIGGSGSAKAKAAFDIISAVLVAANIPVVTAAVNLARELALADAKVAGLITDKSGVAQ